MLPWRSRLWRNFRNNHQTQIQAKIRWSNRRILIYNKKVVQISGDQSKNKAQCVHRTLLRTMRFKFRLLERRCEWRFHFATRIRPQHFSLTFGILTKLDQSTLSHTGPFIFPFTQWTFYHLIQDWLVTQPPRVIDSDYATMLSFVANPATILATSALSLLYVMARQIYRRSCCASCAQNIRKIDPYIHCSAHATLHSITNLVSCSSQKNHHLS